MKKIVFFFSLLLLDCCSFDNDGQELCFVGDSITYLWDTEYYFPNYVVSKYAVIGAGLAQVDSWNVSECRNRTTILLIGTNDIGFWKSTDSDIKEKRELFTNRFLNSAKRIDANPLIVLSILPRNKDRKEDPFVNKNIKEQNIILHKALMREVPNSKFVDVFNFFIRKDYEIREDLFKDGLHPNSEGYEILAREIQKEL